MKKAVTSQLLPHLERKHIGIDVAKDKHDCFAMNSDGEILIEKLTITNN